MRFSSTFYLLLPMIRERSMGEIPGWGREIILSARDQAQGFVGQPVCLVGVSSSRQRLLNLDSGEHLGLSAFRAKGVHFLMNAGFLLSDTPPVQEMIRQTPIEKVILCGLRAEKELHAMAFFIGNKEKKKVAARWEGWLWTVLSRLTEGTEDDTDGAEVSWIGYKFLPANESCEENSPAMSSGGTMESRPSTYSPRRLNTAFQEILSSTGPRFGVEKDPAAMIKALQFQREISKIPWFFNTLINEIEYRLGSVHPASFPPEIHLSTTGKCNIECRFCGYTRDIGRRGCVTRDQVSTMTYLRYAQTFRLASGLGEPCLNPHLSEIISYISENYPHIGMNFFTNGLALNHKGLIEAIVGNIRWISVSLNAASPDSYLAQCRADGFHRICSNLRALKSRKQSCRAVQPLALGSMVLNRMNLYDLPQMPALCRDLGVDRFTAFPYFALGKREGEKMGPSMTLASCRLEYDALFLKTVEAAEKYQVSLEIPPPSREAISRFGLEVRPLYDFARIETNQWTLGRFLRGLSFDRPPDANCPFLWRYAAIGSTNNAGHSAEEDHFISPCIGPLSGVDLSRRTAFRFQNDKDFMRLWRHPVLELLRRAQHTKGVSDVCDICRSSDTRNPDLFMTLEDAVTKFAKAHRDAPQPAVSHGERPVQWEAL